LFLFGQKLDFSLKLFVEISVLEKKLLTMSEANSQASPSGPPPVTETRNPGGPDTTGPSTPSTKSGSEAGKGTGPPPVTETRNPQARPSTTGRQRNPEGPDNTDR
jgi:hypothetical protein